MDDSGNLRRLLARESEDDRILSTAIRSKLLDRSQLVLPDGSPAPDTWTLFQAGERVEIKGRTFDVAWVGTDGLLLTPVKLVVGGESGEGT